MKYPFCSMAPPTLLMFFLVEQCRPVRKPDKIVIHNHLFIAKALQCHQTWNKAVVSLFPFVSYVVKDNWKTYGQIMVHKKSNGVGLRIEKKNSAIWIKVWNDWYFANKDSEYASVSFLSVDGSQFILFIWSRVKARKKLHLKVLHPIVCVLNIFPNSSQF